MRRPSAGGSFDPYPEPSLSMRTRIVGGIAVAAAIGLVTYGMGTYFARGVDRSEPATVYGVRAIKEYPHDPSSFTQGLEWLGDGRMLEGTGQYGQSKLRVVGLDDGKPLQEVILDKSLFGEGTTVWKDRVYQLTWRSGEAIVYDLATLKELRRFKYDGEGWGLTHDDRHLIMSDGSSTLQFRDPETFDVVKTLKVFGGGRRIPKLNELDYIAGSIYANVWGEDYIVRISPENGQVTAWIDLRGLLPPNLRPHADAVLNGIAYDAQGDRLFVTGKNWPRLYQIQLVERR